MAGPADSTCNSWPRLLVCGKCSSSLLFARLTSSSELVDRRCVVSNGDLGALLRRGVSSASEWVEVDLTSSPSSS